LFGKLFKTGAIMKMKQWKAEGKEGELEFGEG
jgi:hypothetical protein